MKKKYLISFLAVVFICLCAFYVTDKINKSVNTEAEIIKTSSEIANNVITSKFLITSMIVSNIIGSYISLLINHPESDKKKLLEKFRKALFELEDDDLREDITSILLPCEQ